MAPPISSQIKKRRAVSEALNRQKVFISSRLVKGDGDTITRVLISGQYYDVRDRTLDRLLEGTTPAELELEPAPDQASDQA